MIQTTAPKMPTVDAAKQALVPDLEKSLHAVTVTAIKPVKLPAGPAVLVSYGSNSDPNPVTNKAIRLENDRYYFWKDDKLVAVNFSAPAGADNADQWDYDGQKLSLAIIACLSSPPTISIASITRARTRRARFAG